MFLGDAVDLGNSTLRSTPLCQEKEHSFSGSQMLGCVAISEPLIRVIVYHTASSFLFLVKKAQTKRKKKVHSDKNVPK